MNGNNTANSRNRYAQVSLLSLALLASCGDREPEQVAASADQGAVAVTEYARPLTPSALWDAHHPAGKEVQIALPGRSAPAKVIIMNDRAYLDGEIIGDVRGQDIIGLSGQRMMGLDGSRGIQTLAFGINRPVDRWTNATIPYVFDGSATTNIRNQFNQAVGVYNTQTNVKFVPRTNQANYVRVMAGSGCYSYVGMMNTSFKPNGQEIGLGTDGCGLGGALHEMGHAAGLEHEQNRSDIDQHLSINFSLIDPNWRSQYEKNTDPNRSLYGPYDTHSIMHYGNSQKNGQWVMTSKEGIAPQEIGKNNGYLTDTDKASFQTIYGGSTGGGGTGGGTSSGYVQVVNKNSGKCLDVAGGTGATGNNTPLTQWDCLGTGQTNQFFKFEATDSGYYKLVAQHSGKIMAVTGGSQANSAPVAQWQFAPGSTDSQWKKVDVGGGYFKLLARHSGKALDVPGCTAANGAVMTQYPDLNNNCQAFKVR